MGLFVKICGIANPEDAAAVAELQPDAMGFIFWPLSPRYVPPERAAEVAAGIPSGIQKVGVFVDEDPEMVEAMVETVGLDVVQCHGDETPGYCAGFPGKVWKAAHLDRFSVDMSRAYPVDAFLVDGYTANAPGGTGRTVDWDLANAFVEAVDRPVLLAGGLNPENITEAVEKVKPWGVDVSSGLESAPGKKDLKKVASFIEQCRRF